MANLRFCYFIFILFCLSCSGTKYITGPDLQTGVSKQLATYRKSLLSDINYHLEFDIPRGKETTIAAVELLSFRLKSNSYPLQLDFKEDSKRIKSLQVNGKSVTINHNDEHLIIATEQLLEGQNEIKIEFDAGNGALNRNEEYLYTLFVPDRARTVFPCFDQPDLKANYTLTLKVPADWKAQTNGVLQEAVVAGDRKTYHFETSDTLSTYLFAFAAGKFEQIIGDAGEMKAEFLFRETDTAKIKPSVPEVFKIHTQALNYLEDWTAIPYPFQKFGFVAIPDFQFGGMEHPGTIQYKSSSLFLDGSATKDQLNARSNLISHETAHMWFGDLVTMNWFTDVWMKEVFANFMADKSTESKTGKDVFDLKFLVDHFPPAYGVDRTTGANPIRQNLDNLKDAGSMYGNIIYHKAPIMMRQLERMMGPDYFQAGVREYLKKFANNNAAWPDLITILDKHTPADLQKWNKVWVNESGRPVFDFQINRNGDKIGKFVITQKPEYGKARIWPQLFEITLFYENEQKQFTVNMNAESVNFKAVRGLEVPLFVLFNSTGQGYGLWPMDEGVFDKVYSIPKPLERASAYISMYENMLNGRYLKPEALLDIFTKGLQKEAEELNLKLISNYISSIYWGFIRPSAREQLAAKLEPALWAAMEKQTLSNNKKILFKTYQDIYLSQEGRDRLYDIWTSQKTPEGLKLTEDDFTSLAFALALRDDKDPGILTKQLAKISNADRKKRFEFIMPAVSSNQVERDTFFKRLELKVNREKEANVGTALYYLHHPLRQVSSIRYLSKSLDMLTEIQTTGDIFFPQNWLQATFGYYQSKEAAAVVRDFLMRNPEYNSKLKAKILQSADNLLRAEKLLEVQ